MDIASYRSHRSRGTYTSTPASKELEAKKDTDGDRNHLMMEEHATADDGENEKKMVWIQSSLIKETQHLSFGQKNVNGNSSMSVTSTRTNHITGENSGESGWEWIYAEKLSQSITDATSPFPKKYGNTVVSIYVADPDSEYHRQTFQIPARLITDDNVLMANDWTWGCELNNQHLGTRFDENGMVTTDANTKKLTWREKQHQRKTNNSISSTSSFGALKRRTSPTQNQSLPQSRAQDVKSEVLPPNDLIHLTHLHEPAVVYALKKRYGVNEIYTSTGPILIALNPFKECQVLYTPNVMKLYWERGEKRRNLRKHMQLPPHVYAVADRAYRNMTDSLAGRGGSSNSSSSDDETATNQSILVSGESGAGKTVTTKIIMGYLATLSSNCSRKGAHSSSSGYGTNSLDQLLMSDKLIINGMSNPSEKKRTIEQQVLQSNPILESFGNARTIRNDNSSRFGKYIEIQFAVDGSLSGASIDTYLLEKVRLLKQGPGERNYHIFYQILEGANDLERKQFFLDSDRGSILEPVDFALLTALSSTQIISKNGYSNSSNVAFDRRDGVKDGTSYLQLKKAMSIMGFTPDEQRDALSLVCAILHASNITFLQINEQECQLDVESPYLPAALSLLGVTADALNSALCLCTIEAGGELLCKTLSIQQSRKALEAVLKAIYSALFTHLVNMINKFIRSVNVTNKAAFIGVLDIFGFESFGINSFEQLCINFCNEALQQQFNLFIFKAEQAEYESEGISWSFISFPDNQDVLDLIDKKHVGVLSILDEQCLLGSCTDRSFALSTYEKCSSHKRFMATRSQRAKGRFSINHYAGPVEYDTIFFLEKNKDELPKEASDLLMSSSIPFLCDLASILMPRSSTISPRGLPTSPRSYHSGSTTQNHSSISNSTGGSNRRSSSLVRVSVSGQFRSQLRQLRERINSTSPHYVRCLKPNDDLLPNHFDSAVIAYQLRCAGILEAIRVSRVGFPQRYPHDRFLHRYGILGPSIRRGNSYTSKRYGCEMLVDYVASDMLKIHNRNEASSSASSTSSVKVLERGARLNLGTFKQKFANGVAGPGAGGSSSVAGRKTNYMEVGMQIGVTKVFLRRWAFDTLEQMLLQKKFKSATVINSVVRMFLARCHFIDMIEEYYNSHWDSFSAEEQYSIASQRGYLPDQTDFNNYNKHMHNRSCENSFPNPAQVDRHRTYTLIERFENIEKNLPKWKRDRSRHLFKWHLTTDGRWVKKES